MMLNELFEHLNFQLDNSIFSPKEESKHSFEKLNCEDALKKAYEVASASCK